ncbi:MAG TPA: carboxypeptidase-like regulatory domain-containing protein [Terrimicrobiaceae bacterium]
MNWKRTAATIGLLVAMAVLLRWLTRSPLSAEAQRKETLEQVIQAYNASIAFYGRVVDQNGDPVAAAKVTYGAIDHFLSKGSDYSGYSDANGYFSINGIKGIALTVGVWKEGYYGIDGKSAGAFAYGINPDSTRSLPPTKDSPAIFLLHKMGETEPLIQVSSRQFDVPSTGQAVSIDLATGRTGQGNLQVAAWIGDDSQRRFDWRYQLSIPGGGLIERKGQFDFEAPADGYHPAIEINMPSTAENWDSRLTKQYFARLADGRYARFSIRFFAGDRNFIVFESYLNPNPDSRNLEFDPKKVVRSENPFEEE